MKLQFWKKEQPQVVDVSKSTPQRAYLSMTGPLDRFVEKYNLQKWTNAVQDAIDDYNPDRNDLLDIYRNCVMSDTHVRGCIDILVNSVLKSEFFMYNEQGEVDEEQSRVIDKKWFYDFLTLCVEAYLWGYTPIQFKDIVNDEFSRVCIIPRETVEPKRMLFRKDVFMSWDMGGLIDLTKKPFSDWVMVVKPTTASDEYCLGRLLQVTKMYILKNITISHWAKYNELYVAPIPVVKQDIRDSEERKALERSLASIREVGALVMPLDTEFEFFRAGGDGGGGFDSYQSFIDYCNKETSKAILGTTMLMEDGSSRSQSEVHQDTTQGNIEAIKKQFIEPVVNRQLLPLMRTHGISIPDSLTFHFKDEDDMGKMEWADVITKLSANFSVDPDFVEQMTGAPVEEKQQEATTQRLDNSSKILDYYKNVSKEWQQHRAQ